jgi:hypothetical protein
MFKPTPNRGREKPQKPDESQPKNSSTSSAEKDSELLTLPSELRAKAQELIEKGETLSLEEFLNSVEEVRAEFRDKVLEARNKTPVGVAMAGADEFDPFKD